MNSEIKDRVDVLARTHKGKIIPVLVSRKGKSYTVKQVKQRKNFRTKHRNIEAITVSVLNVKEMHLEFDYASKSWRLLAIDDDR